MELEKWWKERSKGNVGAEEQLESSSLFKRPCGVGGSAVTWWLRRGRLLWPPWTSDTLDQVNSLITIINTHTNIHTQLHASFLLQCMHFLILYICLMDLATFQITFLMPSLPFPLHWKHHIPELLILRICDTLREKQEPIWVLESSCYKAKQTMYQYAWIFCKMHCHSWKQACFSQLIKSWQGRGYAIWCSHKRWDIL